jgi:NitT/TauT family transport system ATP-binding protein
MAQLDIQQLTVGYVMKRNQRALTAVRDVSFAAQAGEFLAIVGPSGCGKSTLLNTIAGLVPRQAGQIWLDGRPVDGPGRDRAMVFQSPALLPWRTVLKNVAYGLELQGMANRKAEEIARGCLARVGLAEFAESFPAELSGGMQQRANLARALAVQPKVLLCDEPLSALDAQTREYMQAELQRIWLAQPTTTIYVTHHIAEAVFLADRVLVLSASPGQIKADLAVDLPRPRPLSVQRAPPFLALEERIWSLLERPAWLGVNDGPEVP